MFDGGWDPSVESDRHQSAIVCRSGLITALEAYSPGDILPVTPLRIVFPPCRWHIFSGIVRVRSSNANSRALAGGVHSECIVSAWRVHSQCIVSA
jgi:hypothetical protein